MFNSFRTTCPVDAHAKEWIEHLLSWLADQFGLDVFTRRALVLPLAEFFPDRYDASDESVRKLLDRVCRYMDVNPAHVTLDFFTNPDLWLVDDRGR